MHAFPSRCPTSRGPGSRKLSSAWAAAARDSGGRETWLLLCTAATGRGRAGSSSSTAPPRSLTQNKTSTLTRVPAKKYCLIQKHFYTKNFCYLCLFHYYNYTAPKLGPNSLYNHSLHVDASETYMNIDHQNFLNSENDSYMACLLS